jgi:hypothetical protein
LLCTTAGAMAAGVPINWLPAPMVGACGLVLFFDTSSLREYIVFVGGAFMTGKHSWNCPASFSCCSIGFNQQAHESHHLSSLLCPGSLLAACHCAQFPHCCLQASGL